MKKSPTINTRVRQLQKRLRSQFNCLGLGEVQVHLDTQNILQAHSNAAELVTVYGVRSKDIQHSGQVWGGGWSLCAEYNNGKNAELMRPSEL